MAVLFTNAAVSAAAGQLTTVVNRRKGILRTLLSDLFDDANEVVANADRAGQKNIKELGFQLNSLISIFWDSYEEHMEKSRDNLDESIRNHLSELSRIVAEASRGFEADVEKLHAAAFILANAIPKPLGRFPQPIKITPQDIIVDGLVKERIFKVSGNFASSVVRGTTPTFVLGGEEGRLVGNMIGQFEFAVKVDATKPSQLSGSITFPLAWYKELIGISPYVFTFRTGVYPQVAGKIKFCWDRAKKQRIERLVTSSTNMAKCTTGDYDVGARPGWKIKKGSSRFVVVRNCCGKGCNKGRFAREDDTRAVYTVSAGCRSHAISFKIQATEYQEVTTCEPMEEELDISWGQTIRLNRPEASNLKMTFTAFDGSELKQEHPGEISNHFATITINGRTAEVRVKKLKTE